MLVLCAIVAVAAVVLFVVRSPSWNQQAQEASTQQAQPTTPPSVQTTIGRDGGVPSFQVALPPSDAAFIERVLAFEQAYYLLDPVARRDALAPFVDPSYLAGTSSIEDTALADRREGLTVEFSDEAIVTAEDIDATTREVNSLVRYDIIRDGTETVNTVTREHTTFWILVNDEWIVHSDLAP